MAELPGTKDEVYMLSRHKAAVPFTNTTLAADMNIFGWNWGAAELAAYFKGTLKPNMEKRNFITHYLCNYYIENL